MPALLGHEVTAVYAGLRAATEHADYRIEVHAADGYACAAGIRSTGLSAAMAIAEHLVERLGAAGLELAARPDDELPRLRMPNLGEASARPYAQAERIAADPEYGRIVCFCERVTRGEIRDALASPVPPVDARRPAPPHPRAHGPLPGLLLRRAGRRRCSTDGRRAT